MSEEYFKLTCDYKPKGDQTNAINELEEGLNFGLSKQTLLGVTGSGKTFTIANIINRQQRPTLILAPNKTLTAQLYGEMREYFPKNKVEYFVSYYDYYQPEAYMPATDMYIEKDASVNAHVEQMRLSATKSLMNVEIQLLLPQFQLSTVSVILNCILIWYFTYLSMIGSIKGWCSGNWPNFNTGEMPLISDKEHFES